jgi:DNA processing protein
MVAAPVLPAPLVPPNTLQWLALTLTEGLGPTRSKRLVEHFGGVAGIFRASLTELEATGLRATSAQSIFTGKSLDLAQQEMVKVADSKAEIVTLDDPRYPQRLKEVYDPPFSYMCADRWNSSPRRGLRSWVHATQLRTAWVWRSG